MTGSRGPRPGPGDRGGAGLPRFRRAADAIRRRATAAVLASGAATALLLVTGVTLLPPETVAGRGTLVPLAVLAALAVLAGGTAGAARRVRRRLATERLAGETERAAGLAAGDLIAAVELERVPPGTSGSLAEAHRTRVGRALGRSATSFFPRSGPVWRRRGWIGGVGVVGAGLLLATAVAGRPEAASAALRGLSSPWSTAFPPPLPALVVEPGDARVVRGDTLDVRIRAVGRPRIRLTVQEEGEPSNSRDVVVDGGRATVRIGPVEAPLRYWVTASGGGRSDTFHVRPVEPLLIRDLEVRLVYPPYLGRAPETLRRPLLR